MPVGAEMIERALRPGHGQAKTLFGASAVGGILGALIETHYNVGAESYLNIDRMFGSKRV